MFQGRESNLSQLKYQRDDKILYSSEGETYQGGVVHKNILTTGDRLCCLYYKLPFSPEEDVMDGSHAHLNEAVMFVVDGVVEVSVAGELATLKKGGTP